MTRLTLLFSKRGREAFRLPLPPGATLTIGRAADCSVRLPDPERHLSRVHLELRARPQGVFVVDRSVNGTWMEGQRLPTDRPRLLRFRSSVALAGWGIELRRLPAEDAPGSTVQPDEGARPDPAPFAGLVGASPPMRELHRRIERVAPFVAPVLIQGETGSGKELVARAVHALSPRRDAAFVAVNCGAIHGETAHSRLFGHEKGAFTGALSASRGAFREAHGGTLFLDEVAELSLRHQTALLRVLERREVVPLGARTPIAVDYRLVAATHQALDEAVARGTFREDLYFRLDVAVLRVPPLRERPGDIPLLARHFLRQLAPGEPPELSAEAVARLLAHPWPGNVRELRAAMLRALLGVDGGEVGPDDVEVRSPAASTLLEVPLPTWERPGSARESERARITDALARANGNRKQAARLLGVARSTLYARMRRLGLG